jgi:hypothetical protein
MTKQPRRNRRHRTFHRFPVCQVTGKVRLGERKDVRLALRDARIARTRAQSFDLASHRQEVRGYRCEYCHGWHLTSRAAAPSAIVQVRASAQWRPTPLDMAQKAAGSNVAA